MRDAGEIKFVSRYQKCPGRWLNVGGRRGLRAGAICAPSSPDPYMHVPLAAGPDVCKNPDITESINIHVSFKPVFASMIP